MALILGLPTRGSDVTVFISRVHLHPLCGLVEFWGKFSQEWTSEYKSLAKDIQSAGNTFQDLEGNPGDQCLAQIDGTWYRSRIVSRNGLKYTVFLTDKGMTCSATTRQLAWGKRGYFQLPPEVEFCVLANVLPFSPENRWSPMALEFLKTLSGKSVSAHVQEVIVPQRTLLLHVPCISQQMYELGFAKKVSPERFQDFVLLSLQSHSGIGVSPEIQQLTMGAGERLHKQELFMYPELPEGTVETVVVTEVTNPQRIFCQLKVFSHELNKLSEQITQSCEGRMSNCIIGSEMIGFPCATRGSDGRWYRSILQQVFPTSKVVEVLNIDYGTKQFVQVEKVRPLAAEFFRMPVVTYICSLHGVIDKGIGWTTSQIDYLRSLLLYKTVIAKFEYQSISEGVYYVTLYGDNNINMNTLFGSKESSLLEHEQTLGDYAIRSRRQHPTQQERKKFTPGQVMEKTEGKAVAERVPAERLLLNSSHVAVVHHITNPSEFYIQTKNYTKQLDELMDTIYHLFKESVNIDAVRIPTVGLYCAARVADGDFYRATVTEVGETQVKVFLVDYGNTEDVDRRNIKTLPAEFKKLPRLALKCTLAGVRPKDGRWSQSASEVFSKVVTDKELNVHVLAKYGNGYAVQLTDSKAQGEQDIGTLMCNAGVAERADMPRQPEATFTVQPDIMPPTQCPDTSLLAVTRNSALPFQAQNTAGLTRNETTNTFKEHVFPIGCVLDVSVSYIESPNDFWCQQLHTAGLLKMLMHDIQGHYAGSEFEPNVEMACVARHPDNGMWYRALVVHKHETPHVDVLFVDYGQTETVSLFDLRRISPEFLILHGQAFRCSLLNPIDPMSAVNDWSEEAVARFQNFVDTAASNFVILKCTIYAVMYSEQKVVFNIVDLETPFENICTSMVSLVKSAPSKKSTQPPFRLDTYYYSTHKVKTGTEEKVTVTCVNSVSQFYCQLEKNADVMTDLKMKVSRLCHQLENLKLPAVFGTLCFARYTDGQWYRGQIKATKPAVLVHFVDYGDTTEVDKSDLLPVPREANDIMSVPVQAVLCGLADVPANVPSEVNNWFEKTVTDCHFQALVVAREPNGKLLVELYHGNSQINSELKKIFQLEMHTEKEIVCQGWRTFETSVNHSQKTPKALPKQATNIQDDTQVHKKNNFSASKPPCPVRDERKFTDMNLWASSKSAGHVCQNVKAPLELYTPPHQRQSGGRMPSDGIKSAGVHIKPSDLPIEGMKFIKSTSHGTKSLEESNVEKLPEISDLPSNSITPGMVADVYVSHCNSPLSFYVQCVREEDEIFSLVEKLNDPKSTQKTNNLKDVHPGDLVQAEFAEDSSWYRAVVREIHGKTMALVEFVDFGNTAMTPLSKIGRLHKDFLQLPKYSTHCMLSDAAILGEEVVFDPDVVSAFKEDVAGSGEKVFKCQFIKQIGSVWEVSLGDNGVNVTCKVPTSDLEITSEKFEQKPARISSVRVVPESTHESELNHCSLHNRYEKYFEGQVLEVYITTINDDQTFWCQSARSEELDNITLSLGEVSSAADEEHTHPAGLYPGSLCIALFSDDQLWYRAEVLDKNESELSVFFVDYGNKSQVSITDVREIPPFLLEIPPQAFLCELEGFDTSCGSWDSGAAGELNTLTADTLLQVTITKITRSAGKTKAFVRMESEGQVINEVMKTWWKCCITEDKPDASGMSDLYKPPLQLDSAVTEAVLPEHQLELPETHPVDSSLTCIHLERDNSEEHSTDEVVDPCEADDVGKLASSPKNGKCFKDSVYPNSSVESSEEETACTERIVVQAAVISVNVSLPCGTGIDETMLPPLDNNRDQDVLTMSYNMSMGHTNTSIAEESALLVDTLEPDDLNSPLDENLLEEMDHTETATNDSASPFEEVDTASSSFDTVNVSNPTKNTDDREFSFGSGASLNCGRAVKMIPRKAFGLKESADLHETAEFSKQIDAELALPSLVPPAKQLYDVSTERKSAWEEFSCVATQAKSDSVREEVVSAHDKASNSALLADNETVTRETTTYTVPTPEQDDEIEEACSADVCPESKEPSGDGKEFLGSAKAEENIICITSDKCPKIRDDLCKTCAEDLNNIQNGSLETLLRNTVESGDVASQDEVPWTSTPNRNDLMTEDETLGLHKSTLCALPSDTEPQTYTASSPNLSNLVEEVTCLVGEFCLTDFCQDLQQEAETVTVECELQAHTPPQQNKDFDDSVLAEETSSLAEDSFAVQLSKMTHLCLIINNGSANELCAEQQPEE